jgi:hypothetical protein
MRSGWSRILETSFAGKNVVTLREVSAVLIADGRTLTERAQASARHGRPQWRKAAMRAMRDIGFRFRICDETFLRESKNPKPAPKTVEAPTPKLLRMSPEVFVARRSPRASMIGGAA